MQVCAHDSDAERVYEHADEADNDETIDLAAAIEMGSSDASDESAMRKITEFCEDNGYDYDKDGRFGRDDERTKEDQDAADEETTDEPSETAEPWNRRMIAYGAGRQTLTVLGFAIGQNALCRWFAEATQEIPRAA